MNQRAEDKTGRLARIGALLLIPLTILIGDFEFRWVQEHAREPLVFWPWFLGSVGLSVALWWGLVNLVKGSRLRWIVLPLVVMPLGVLIVASWRFRTLRHYDPAATVVAFLIEEPLYAIELALAGVSPGWLAALVSVPIGWLAAALYGASGGAEAESPSRSRRLVAGAAVLSVPLMVWTTWPSVVENPWTPYPTDIRLLKVGEQGVSFYSQGVSSIMMRPAQRNGVAPVEAQERPSVLLILAESVRNDRTQLWGDPGRQTTPRLAEFSQSRPDEVFAFQQHTANAAATLASGIGLMLGKHYAAPADVLRSAPVVWQYAQAAGMETFLVSAQPWGWANLTGFYIDHQPPDAFWDAEALGLEVVNDAGGDDLQAADKVVELIGDASAKAEPFFGIFQLNATHFPYHALDEVSWPIEGSVDRYDAAMARSDAAVGKVLRALEEKGKLDSTVVIFVSDHAVELNEAKYREGHQALRRDEPAMFQGARVSSCEPVYARTPMLMYVPEKWQKRLGLDGTTLAANTDKLSSHVDILPTVLELWSMPPHVNLDGQSLLVPVPEDRLAYCFTASRVPEVRGVGIHAADRYVYLRKNLSRPHAFDIEGLESFESRRMGEPLEERDGTLIERACRESTAAREVLGELDEKFELAGVPCE